MRGGAICADINAAEKTKERTETIFRNLSIATPSSILMASENGLKRSVYGTGIATATCVEAALSVPLVSTAVTT
jgi:hypothetical protein